MTPKSLETSSTDMNAGTRVWLRDQVDDVDLPEWEQVIGTIQPEGAIGFVEETDGGDRDDEYSDIAPGQDMVVVRWHTDGPDSYLFDGCWEPIADLVPVGDSDA